MELWEHTHKNNDIDQHLMFEINKDIQLYGYNTEVKLFRNAVYSYNQYIKERTDIKRKEMFQKFNKFFESSFNTYRREIVLNNLDDNIKE